MKNRSLSPQSVKTAGRPYGRPHFAVGQRMYALLALGLGFVPLMFLSVKFGWAMLAWNILVVMVFFIDLKRLPDPTELSAERSFQGVLEQLHPADVQLTFENHSTASVLCTVIDSVPEALLGLPAESEVLIPAGASVEKSYRINNARRGDHTFGALFMRYEGPLRIAQRWAEFDLSQQVRVYPSIRDTGQQQAMLIRSRKIELQRRTIRQRGQGREFESLREFQVGDERRDICWTATARRSHLVTTLRQTERSQTIWSVVDCGRLMRARLEGRSKLDYATECAMRLAHLSSYGGDLSALLGYGQKIQQRRLPGRGNQHVNAMLDQLALLQEEAGEADHLYAASTLMLLQKRRAMIVWITDLADLAITPEIVTAALQANKRHLVVVAVLGQPDVAKLTTVAPTNIDETFLYAAASETTRRRELMLARLRGSGVHVIEVNAPHLTGAVLNKYLEVKQKNLL